MNIPKQVQPVIRDTRAPSHSHRTRQVFYSGAPAAVQEGWDCEEAKNGLPRCKYKGSGGGDKTEWIYFSAIDVGEVESTTITGGVEGWDCEEAKSGLPKCKYKGSGGGGITEWVFFSATDVNEVNAI